jgi:hypothetical protein
LNETNQTGVSGPLLATPPGTCTGVPGGLPGDCSMRASQAAIDWAEGYYAYGTRWSDATAAVIPAGTSIVRADGSLDPVATGTLDTVINTHVGASWIPASCNRPWCGNLLRGDVISHLDENGDGKFDDTWIDDGDNIREFGEVDRTRAEQFAWGLTSVIREMADLSLVVGNVTPPGISRMRTRIALGDAALDPDAGCDGDIMNPECHNAVVTAPDLTGLTTTAADDDAAVFGKCDPDRPEFVALMGDPFRAQRALDNCLWFFASFPVTAPSPGDLDPLHNQLDPRLRPEGLDPIADPFAVRETWIDQRVVGYIASSDPLQQDYTQNWFVNYRFNSPASTPDIASAVYKNEWRMSQSDLGAETYDYNFVLQHISESRRRGFTFDADVPVDECVPPLAGATCDGLSNPTVDPFWGKAIVRLPNGDPDLNPDGSFKLNFDQNFEFFNGQPCDEACRESGVGHEISFTFLYQQAVEGFVSSCLNCSPHLVPLQQESVNYDFTWPGIPSIASIPHPPASATTLPVFP